MAFLNLMKSFTGRAGKHDGTAASIDQIEKAMADGDTQRAMSLVSEARAGGRMERRTEVRLDLVEGTILLKQGKPREACEHLREVWESGFDDLAVEAGMAYLQCLTECQSHQEALRVCGRLVELLASGSVRHGEVQVTAAGLLLKTGETGQAEEKMRAAIRSLESAGDGPEWRSLLIDAHSGLGDIHLAQEDAPSALIAWRQALRLCADLHGPNHPQTAAIQAGVGTLEMMTDDLAAARRSLEQALATYKAIGRNETMEAAIALSNLAFTLLMLEDLPGAEAAATEAVALSKGANPNVHMEAKDILRKIQTARTAVRP